MTQAKKEKIKKIMEADGVNILPSCMTTFSGIVEAFLVNNFEKIGGHNSAMKQLKLSKITRQAASTSKYFTSCNFTLVEARDYGLLVACTLFAGCNSIEEFLEKDFGSIPDEVVAYKFLFKEFIGQKNLKTLPVMELQNTNEYIIKTFLFYKQLLRNPELGMDDFEMMVRAQKLPKQTMKMVYTKTIIKTIPFSKKVRQENFSLELYKIIAMYLYLLKYGTEEELALIKTTKKYMDEELNIQYDKHYIYMLCYVYCYNFLKQQDTIKKDNELLFLMLSFILGKDADIREQRKRIYTYTKKNGKYFIKKILASINIKDYLYDKPEIVNLARRYAKYGVDTAPTKHYLAAFADYCIMLTKIKG